SVGANALSDLCATLEKTGKAEDWDGIDDALPHLEPTLGLILEYIEGL
ncbi:MAG: hypothetical protein HOF84_01290, partial [Rhodospirillales bacterium]|nr:hypothetical protein [Rhodospirillales bacterium]